MHSSVPELGVSDVGLGGGNDSGNVYALLITITSVLVCVWGGETERKEDVKRTQVRECLSYISCPMWIQTVFLGLFDVLRVRNL